MSWSRKPKPWTPPEGRGEEILSRIKARSEEEGDCLLVRGGKRPNVRYGDRAITVQKAAWLLHGNDLPEGRYVISTCRDPRCVNPDHLTLITQKGIAKRAANSIQHKSALRAIRIAAKFVHRQKVSDSQVLDIRGSEEPTSVLAARYAVSEGLIRKIRAGTARRAVAAGMWTQLMRG